MDKRSQRGQSLVEILVGIGIISIMIGASTYALVSVLRSSTVTEQNQTGGMVENSLLESASTLAEADWNKIYDLSKGSSYHYFVVNSPTTTPMATSGDESVLSDNITNGLVGHWKFDESSTNTTWAYDSSGQGNLGALANSPTRTASTSCKVEACLSFDGLDDYVEATVSQTKIAYSLWVKNGSVWEYVVNNNGTYYVNGVSGTPTSYPIYVSGSVVQIGKSGASSYVQAFVDDVRIYNRTLSAAEINQLYNSQVYSRYFYVDNVNRTACGSGDVTSDETSSCLGSSGINEDPATQKITIITFWNQKGISQNMENSIYVTRWINSYAKQSNWDGHSGVDGSLTEFGSDYYSYSNISTTTSGSIKIEDLVVYLAIGDSYQGGIIAYILQPGDAGYDANVQHGLIAAASDQGTDVPWGCSGSAIDGADGTAIGTGNQNTIDIMAGCATAGIAARLCGDLVLNGYSDWYLPSKDELNKLYINRVVIGGFTGDYYWSSSEDTENFAWVQFYSNGEWMYGYRSNEDYIRAIRAF